MYKDFSEPSLRAGIDLLRDSSQWPEGFTWNYANSCRCAMGLFRDTWDQAGMPVSTRTSALLGIDEDKGGKVFSGCCVCGARVLKTLPLKMWRPSLKSLLTLNFRLPWRNVSPGDVKMPGANPRRLRCAVLA